MIREGFGEEGWVTNRIGALENLSKSVLDRVVDLFDDVLVAVGKHEKHSSQDLRIDKKAEFWRGDDQIDPTKKEKSCHLVCDLFDRQFHRATQHKAMMMMMMMMMVMI